jgi:hypothetical protein
MGSLIMEPLPSSLAGEDAVIRIPARGPRPEEACIHAKDLRDIDAYGGAALRAWIEYYARYHKQFVTVSECASAPAWALFHGLQARDPPAHLKLTDDATTPPGTPPRSILLPAVRVETMSEADALSDLLHQMAGGQIARQVRFLAGVLPELVLNALTHASGSPISPVACALHHRPSDRIQLVVADMGEVLARSGNAGTELLNILQNEPESALNTLAERAEEAELEPEILLATGPGRVEWAAGEWIDRNGSQVHGFVAGFSLPV